jgi:hypothetical protein
MVEVYDIKSRKNIVEEMYKIIHKYHNDVYMIFPPTKIRSLGNLTVEECFNFIKNIRYEEDQEDEIIGRPLKIWELLKKGKLKGLDCKKKSVLAGSYAYTNEIPFKFCVVSTRKDREPHHIFPIFYIQGKPINFEATYYYYQLNTIPYNITYKEIY